MFTGANSLLRRVTAASSLILLLGLALLVLSAPAAGAPVPDPSPSSVSPDPYGPASTPPADVHVVVPAAPALVYRAPAPATPPAHKPAAHKAPAKHAARGAVTTTPGAIRFRRFFASSIGDVAAAGTRVSTGLALAVAVLVLLSGALVAGVAREVAR